jgi:transposase-like protein/ribosomal protein L37AE/L43A
LKKEAKSSWLGLLLSRVLASTKRELKAISWSCVVAYNKVQFQEGLSEPEFDRPYGTEEQCRAVVIAARWPNGFVCPECGRQQQSIIKSRGLFQCSDCRRQTSLIAGTIFAATKIKLRFWFRALSHITQSKQGISSIELGRRLGVRQKTAWSIKHKLQQVMLERDARKRLTGRVEIDDAYLGGERTGGKRGRGAAGKTPFVAAVQTTQTGKPVSIKLRRVDGFTGEALTAFATKSLDPACQVVSDGRTYRSISSKHTQHYLAEFEYRFNRRLDLKAMIPRLTWASVRTPPMPYQLLKSAEVYA